MAILSDILQRNQREIVRMLVEHDIKPDVAELVLHGILDSLPRRKWESLRDPDRLLLRRVQEACLQVEDIRRQAAFVADIHRASSLWASQGR
jgi:hypothetical protein